MLRLDLCGCTPVQAAGRAASCCVQERQGQRGRIRSAAGTVMLTFGSASCVKEMVFDWIGASDHLQTPDGCVAVSWQLLSILNDSRLGHLQI